MKKASLNLSIQAIVVLILAIAILGLGLGFLKTMWDRLTGQIIEIDKDIEKRMLDSLKTSTDRLVVDMDNVEIKQGKEKQIYFALRNELGDPGTFKVDGGGTIATEGNPGFWTGDSVITCFAPHTTEGMSGKNEQDNYIYFKVSPKERYLEDEAFVGSIIIDVNGRAPLDVYQCSIVIKEPDPDDTRYARKDFMVTVV